MMLANRAKIATAIIAVQSQRLSSTPRETFRLRTARAIISTVDDRARNPIYHRHVCVVDNAASKGEFRLNPNRKVDPLRRVEPRGSRQFTSIIPRQRDEKRSPIGIRRQRGRASPFLAASAITRGWRKARVTPRRIIIDRGC